MTVEKVLCLHSQGTGGQTCLSLCLQARFSTFLWVQAIDLAIITTRAGVLCESLPEGSFLSPYRCMAMVLSTHFVVTYALIGSVVWKMDQQERRSFLYQHQRANAAVQ